MTFGVVCAVVLAAWGTRIIEGRQSIESSDAATARGDRVEAIVFARAAAEARCPFCGASELGYERLYAIAKDAESVGDDSAAVAAWRAVRAAALATSVIDMAADRRQRADEEIARLEHRIDVVRTSAGAAPSPAATEERLRAALAASSVPSGTVFLLVGIGAALFVVGAARFVRARGRWMADLAFALAGIALAALGLLFF